MTRVLLTAALAALAGAAAARTAADQPPLEVEDEAMAAKPPASRWTRSRTPTSWAPTGKGSARWTRC